MSCKWHIASTLLKTLGSGAYAGGVSEFPETPPERHGLARMGLARTMHTRE